jgi:hypothetical protein
MRRIGEAYQMEGMLIFVQRRRKQTVTTAGGSFLGQEYLDMTDGDPNTIGPAQDFTDFVNGHKIIKKLTGADPLRVKKPRKPRKGRKVLADGKYDKGESADKLVHLPFLN